MNELTATPTHASVLYLRLGEFAAKAVMEQARMRAQLEAVVAAGLSVLPERDRIVLDAHDGIVLVVLDNAPFHTARAVREREEGWEEMGLSLYRLPAYCPHLNLIEGVWRRVKSFLMPRRFYDSLGELKVTVLDALRLLGAREVHIQLGDT